MKQLKSSVVLLIVFFLFSADLFSKESEGKTGIPPRTKVDRLKCFWTFGNHEPISMYRRIGKKSTGGIEGNAKWLEKWHHWFDSEECPKFMEDHGLNFIHSRFYKGMGWNFESKDFPNVRQFVKNCHKHGVRVLAYVQFSTVYYEIMKEEYPNIEDWACINENGKPVTYGTFYFRWKTCINNPEFEDLLKKMITIALTEGEFDGIMFDNLEAPPCYCERCTQLFREFLGKEKNPLEKFGLPTVKNVQIPYNTKADQNEIKDPILQQWYLFRARQLTDLVCRLRLHAKQCKSDAIVSANIWDIRNYNRMYLASINISSLVDGYDLLIGQNSNSPKIEKGGVVHRIHDFKFAEEVDLPILALCDEDAGRSEEGRYLLPILEDMIFGGIPTDRTIMRADKQMINPELLAFRAPLLKKIQNMIKTNDQALSAPEYRPVRVLYSEESHLFSFQSWGGTFLAEEILLHNHIPYGLLITKESKPLVIPNDCEVLIVPDQRCLSDQELEILIKFAKKGGRLIITGQTGDYHSLYDERLVNPLDEALKGLPNVIYRKNEGVPLKSLLGKRWMIRSGNEEEKHLLSDLDKIWTPQIRIEAPDTVFVRINRESEKWFIHLLNYQEKSTVKKVRIRISGTSDLSASCSIPLESEKIEKLSLSKNAILSVPDFREYCLIQIDR